MSSSSNVFETLNAATHTMIQSLARADVAIPVLFVGDAGAGQDDAALHLCKALLCSSLSNGDPCGMCSACKMFDRNLSPDFLLIKPQGKANLIRIHQIESSKNPDDDDQPQMPLLEFIRVAPVQARNKVALIKNADRLVINAANSLLKTLEESPQDVRIVLTSHASGRIPQTIRSRCCIVPCAYLTDSNIDPAVLRLSAGTPDLAAFLSNEAMLPFAQEFWNWIENWTHRPRSQALKASEEFIEICDRYHELLPDSKSRDVRTSRAEMFQFFANGIASKVREGNRELISALEAALFTHRAVTGNAAFNYLCDSFFTNFNGKTQVP